MAITKSEKRRKIATSPSTTTPKRKIADNMASPLTKRGLTVSPAGSPSSPITPRAKSLPLPSHLSRMVTIHTALETSLSLSLATSSRAPSQLTGHLPAITNTVALESAGLRVRCGVEEIRRLCWLWEWDGCTLPQSVDEASKPGIRSTGPLEDSSEDNPFLDSNTPRKSAPAPTPPPTDWLRGGMGLIVTPTTQIQRAEGRRVPAYGIGIKVEVTSDDSVGVALSAAAKWTADSHLRRKELTDKLHQWVKVRCYWGPVIFLFLRRIHTVTRSFSVTPKANGKTKRLRSLSPVPIPPIPFADLPPLSSIPMTSTPSTQRILQTPSKGMFSTPSRGTISTPTFARRQGGFGTPSSGRSVFNTPSHRKGGIFATPTSAHRSGAGTPATDKRLFDMAPPMTPTTRAAGVPLPLPLQRLHHFLFKSAQGVDPQTPRKDKDATPSVPMTPRQAALAERLRQRGLATPSGKTTTVTLGYDAETDTVRTAEATPAELRRRCLLARLPDAAETLLAMFTSRRVIPLKEAARSIVSASRVTTQEAEDEIRMLAELCPKFLRIRIVERDEWVERGTGIATGKTTKLSSPSGSKSSVQPISSPAHKSISGSGVQTPSTPARTGSKSTGTSKLAAGSPSSSSLASATPRKAKELEVFGLREIRELVRRELEGGI
ncbi:DNA replication factor Cdt1 C-terminal domain [Rhizoctonia solani]|uniref:DNA replication factor Cdt1 C-terminal domain n=1 Tax=Rhizoctonia solani TaxID=456999 RepID=A0A8H7M743_9AGAM|nr:DNA replication factor Cdt1 C-terminal domain [Rhizoctonia solani]